MNRVTRADIEAELSRLIVVSQRLGLKSRAEQWMLMAGSVQNNVPWRLLSKSGRNVTPVAFVPEGVIGANRTEVLNNIKVLRYAFEQACKMWER